MNARTLLPAILCLALFPTICRAQERGQVGVTMGFPTAAGLIWHATDRVAIRPDIRFSQVTAKAELSLPNVSTKSTDRTLGLGASLLWFLGSSDGDVRPYVSPRFLYSRLTEDDGDDGEPTDLWTLSGSFGVQYTPVRRFGVYGEVGFGREHTEATRSFPGITVTTSVTSWSTRSAVGVIFYFGS